ncbi:hypothetical protein Barb4_02055 [Bacteroidales bacterium Barb4]|nr:hypothetical protein Barb4_02055 [Bacteroidales bacterium Barb4]
MRIRHPPRKRKHIPPVGKCHIRRNQRTSFLGGFHHNRGIRQSCHNPVAHYKVRSVRICPAREISQQTALLQHFHRRIPVRRRIDAV